MMQHAGLMPVIAWLAAAHPVVFSDRVAVGLLRLGHHVPAMKNRPLNKPESTLTAGVQ